MNKYPHFDFGRWESYPGNIENIYETGSGGTLLATMQRSSDFSHGGSFSGKVTFKNFKTNPSYYSPNLFTNLVKFSTGPREQLSVFGPSDVGKEFLFEIWVYTPSSNPIGSADLSLQIGPMVFPFLGPPAGTISPISIVSKTVAEFTDTWAKLEYRFILQNNNGFYISIYADDSALRSNDILPALGDDLTGTLNVNGVFYFDDIVLTDLTALECDLELGSPAFTKTNETGTGLNDGTITMNASSSYSRQYSLDEVTWQTSPTFTGLAPGTYTVYVRDTNPTGCNVEQAGIVISSYVPVDPPEPPEPGPLVVNCEPVNMNNFISWMSSVGPVVYTELQFTNCNWDFANAYRLNKKWRKHYPIVCNNEEFTFYVNFESEEYNDPNFSDYRLHLIDNAGVVQSNIAALQQDLFSDGVTYNIYAAITLVNVPIGVYRLAIVNNAIGSVLFISNEIQVMTLDDAKNYSTRFQFRASFNMYKFRYLSVPDYINKIRLKFYKIDQTSEGELSQYRSVSSGALRNTSVELDRARTFETYFFDDLANNAMEIFAVHDLILLNNKVFIAKGLFKADYIVSNNVNKGKIEMYEQAFSTVNRYGNIENILIPSSPLLLGDGGGFIEL